MTEAEWLAAADPAPMVAFLEGKASYRKRRLFSLTCCRWVERLIPDWPCAGLVDVLEELADDRVDPELIPEQVISKREQEPYTVQGGPHLFDFADAVLEAAFDRKLEEASDFMQKGRGPQSVVCHTKWAFDAAGSEVFDPATILVPYLRDIFGNPFRPVSFSPSWRTDTALSLARQMYENRDFGAMPILADALQDAGCDNEDILQHCRS